MDETEELVEVGVALAVRMGAEFGAVTTTGDVLTFALGPEQMDPSGEIKVSGLNFTEGVCLLGGLGTDFEAFSKSNCITFPQPLSPPPPPVALLLYGTDPLLPGKLPTITPVLPPLPPEPGPGALVKPTAEVAASLIPADNNNCSFILRAGLFPAADEDL